MNPMADTLAVRCADNGQFIVAYRVMSEFVARVSDGAVALPQR
jgi:hypothetical protein